MEDSNSADNLPTAYLVDLVSNRKIPISVPRCKAGRDDLNDVVITGDQSISRFHFVISREGEQYYVQDSQSRHGTFLNGNPLTVSEPMKDGDVLKVGVSLFWFVIDSPANSGSSPAIQPAQSEKTAAAPPEQPLAPAAKSPAQTAATRTSDNMPAMQPDSSLAARMSAKAQAAGASDQSQAKPASGGLGLSRLLSPEKFEDETATNEEISEISPVIAQAKDELNSDHENDDPDFSDFEADKLEASIQLKEIQSSAAEQDDANLTSDNNSASNTELEMEQVQHPSSTTLELFAEAIGEAAVSHDDLLPFPAPPRRLESVQPEMAKEIIPTAAEQGELNTASSTAGAADVRAAVGGNGARDAMNMVKQSSMSTGPDWCNSYLSSELQGLNQNLSDYSDKVRQAQEKVQEIEDRIAVTKSLRNALLLTQGDELVGACIRVLTYLGWNVKPSAEDKQELQLLTDNKVCIARVVWTNNTPERTHLGQLTISQTRYWCEQGAEPKGILIVSRCGDETPTNGAPDPNSELADYARKKNVCLMTTLQLLSLYRDAVLNSVNSEGLRGEIMSSSGWLPGFNLESNTESGDKPEASANRLSSLLSA